MYGVLAFAALLMAATLLSDLAQRSVFSLSVLFLAGGALAGNLGFFAPDPTDPFIGQWTEVALFAVLFTDGMRLSLNDLSHSSHWPGRALILGLPITLLGIAILGRLLLGLSWVEGLLVGSILSPTDPVLTSAIAGAQTIPEKVRHLLQVESGLNDGLALPIVFVLLRLLQKQRPELGELGFEVVGGIAIGLGVAWISTLLKRWCGFSVSREYETLFVSAVGIGTLAISSVFSANEFLAAFAAGLMLRTRDPNYRAAFTPFGKPLVELLKLSGLFLFGTLIRPAYLDWTWPAIVFAITVLVIPRTVGLGVALTGTKISRPEFWTAAWFGPRGFASMLYSIYVLKSGITIASGIFGVTAAVIVASVVAHSSTDILAVRWFRQAARQSQPAANT